MYCYVYILRMEIIRRPGSRMSGTINCKLKISRLNKMFKMDIIFKIRNNDKRENG
jgi:hypothetical protein